jgi:threonine/homoserine/homoserine lactone efflux protein
METEGIGELFKYIISGFFLIVAIASFVSAWMSEIKRTKIQRIIMGVIFMVIFILTIVRETKLI